MCEDIKIKEGVWFHPEKGFAEITFNYSKNRWIIHRGKYWKCSVTNQWFPSNQEFFMQSCINKVMEGYQFICEI
jgi:hypothetical protein